MAIHAASFWNVRERQEALRCSQDLPWHWIARSLSTAAAQRRLSPFRSPSGRSTRRCSRKKMDNLDFAKIAKDGLRHRRRRVRQPVLQGQGQGRGVPGRDEEALPTTTASSVLIMCDGEGEPRRPRRRQAEEGRREPSQVGRGRQVPRLPLDPRQRRERREPTRSRSKLAADGLRRLTEFGDKHGINVIVENHGGLSSQRRVAGAAS